ncbi:MAG: metalloregulator ArsR/SmtB family transcription factor [Lentisphaeria bacterium]|nr:metalloregulator ArsR/SmtB family transcription factor [Lentisphaeria bacterium]
MPEKNSKPSEVVHKEIVDEIRVKMSPKQEYTQMAVLFKLCGDGTRAQLLHALLFRELCVCDLAALLGVTKSAVSHQLKALRLANLVSFRRDGQNVYYSLSDEHVRAIIKTGFEHIRE